MANKKAAWRFSLIPLLLLCWANLNPALQDRAGDKQTPLWWDLKVELKTEGQYRTQQEETVYTGNYQLTVLWTGIMERDAEDYRLFHGRSETTRWSAQETASSPTSLKTLSGDDFRDAPKFNMEYVLKKEDQLHFAFFVNGFRGPRNESAQKSFILLPFTEENQLSLSGPNYRTFIVAGSNSVWLDERDIYKKACRKEFKWTCKQQQWSLKEKRTTLFSNRHQARVLVSVSPHYEE